MKFRQGLLVTHIQESVKPLMDSLVPGALHWWVGVGNDRSIADYSRKRTSRPKIYTANLFLHNCTLPENYMLLLAPHENKHPLKQANC